MLSHLLILMIVVSGTALWAVIGGSLSFAQDGGDAKRHIELENGSLSVDLRDVAMSDVLMIIGEQARVMVSICGKLGTVKAQAFRSVPLEEGIKKLAETNEVDILMIYGPRRQLTEVRAYKWPLGPPPTPPPLRIPIPGTQSLRAQHK